MMNNEARDDRDDALDRLFAEACPQPPAGLDASILAAVADEESSQRIFWEDVRHSARAALIASAAVLLLSLAFLGQSLRGEPAQLASPPPVAEPLEKPGQDEPRLAEVEPQPEEVVEPSFDEVQLASLESGLEQLSSSYWLFNDED